MKRSLYCRHVSQRNQVFTVDLLDKRVHEVVLLYLHHRSLHKLRRVNVTCLE